VLGLGFSDQALANGVAAQPDIIAIDGGSTDSGPWYLGTGRSKYSPAVCKAEWRKLMQARATLNVPLVIGSCGTCGVDDMVDWMAQVTREIAAETGQSVKIAKLYSSQTAEFVTERMNSGNWRALQPELPLDSNTVQTASNIVALAGIEQIQLALQSGADIILAGRATDTASIAALPVANGENIAAAWHGAKVAECGALCSTHPTSGVVLLDVDQTGFTITPMEPGARCTPHTVSAHMLYENADPFLLHEPGGTLDVTEATYEAIDDTSVRVQGSHWIQAEQYTVKLEAARSAGFQTTLLALLRDRHYVENVSRWTARLEDFLIELIRERLALDTARYDLDFRHIGVDATLGTLENRDAAPVEVGVLLTVTADTAEQSMEIARLCNPHMLHYPLTDNEELPTFAFPYSPVETARGELFEFFVNHVMQLDDPMQAFRLETEIIDATG
jgi:hypothetical protein